jgi:aspartate kinase
VTNELIARAKSLCPEPSERELDQLLAIGEQESIALMAMALHGIGVRPSATRAPRPGIFTDKVHTKAKIKMVNPKPVERT